MNEYNDQQIIAKLKETHLHITQNRVAVYKMLAEQKTALSVSVIIKGAVIPLNRISVYRALRYFLQKGIVHIIPNSKGVAKYILAEINKENVSSDINENVYFFAHAVTLQKLLSLYVLSLICLTNTRLIHVALF